MSGLTKQRVVNALDKMRTHASRVKILDTLRIARETGDRETQVNALNFVSSLIAAPLMFANEMIGGRDQLSGAIQAFSTSSDLPEMITRGFDVFKTTENVDNRALESFKIREFDDGRGFIEILSVENGLKIEKIEEGQPVKYSKISGSSVKIDAVTFGGGFQFSWELIEDRQYSLIMDMVQELTMGAMRSKSKELYGLLQSTGLANGTLPLPATGTPFEKGIKAINEAAQKVSIDTKDEVWVDSANAPMNLYCHAGDVNVALLKSFLNYITVYNGSSSETITSRQINLIPSHNLGDLGQDEALLVLPGGKIQYADKVAATSYTEDNIDHFATKQTVRMRYAAGVANVKQAVVLTYK